MTKYFFEASHYFVETEKELSGETLQKTIGLNDVPPNFDGDYKLRTIPGKRSTPPRNYPILM